MDKGILIIILVILVIAPVAYFLGIRMYLGILLVLAMLFGIFVALKYAWWYVMNKME